MIDDLLLLGFAVFAVANAVAHTEAFRWVRNLGRWAYARGPLLYHLLMPARASLCTVCISFWIAMPAPWLPVAPELEGVGRILLWLAPVGISSVLAYFTEPKDAPLFPELDDIGPRPGDGPTGAENQTADEVP